ncbi:hypothetical protein LOD99_9952 [Oopsacas minuta]|uniref:60S ribosomal protein L12 n=1 Tax=Oopsacas minuta TaxID=111878 RepID=A0AAV7KNE0_9METZ|nr:hypothetical protein LOD99_9952 [Oopsacas minuta]
MPPKLDPTEVKIIYVRAVGGESGNSATLAPKIGPLGLAPKKVGEDISKCTQAYKGLRVTVKLTIQNRQAQVEIEPSASTLIIHALKEPARDRKKVKNIRHAGNLTLDQIKEIAHSLEYKSLSKSFTGTVLQVLGTAQSVGCNVEKRTPREIIEAIRAGDIDVES